MNPRKEQNRQISDKTKLTGDINSTWIINLEGRTTLCRFETQTYEDTDRQTERTEKYKCKRGVCEGAQIHTGLQCIQSTKGNSSPHATRQESEHSCFVTSDGQERRNYYLLSVWIRLWWKWTPLAWNTLVIKQACPQVGLFSEAHIRLQDPVEKG